MASADAFQAKFLAEQKARVESLLTSRLELLASGAPPRLLEAMRYSLLGGGKRLRPILCLAFADVASGSTGGGGKVAEDAACAVEYVHTYSLIHDDLPAMDDDDVRRGRPTSHKVFGEATAILAGDGLLTLAFEWIADAGAQAGVTATPAYLEATAVLARAAGPAGMVRGQARDLAANPPETIEQAEILHSEKTAALFQAAIDVGAVVAGAGQVQREVLARFARAYGIAFQHADDLSDEDRP